MGVYGVKAGRGRGQVRFWGLSGEPGRLVSAPARSPFPGSISVHQLAALRGVAPPGAVAGGTALPPPLAGLRGSSASSSPGASSSSSPYPAQAGAERRRPGSQPPGSKPASKAGEREPRSLGSQPHPCSALTTGPSHPQGKNPGGLCPPPLPTTLLRPRNPGVRVDPHPIALLRGRWRRAVHCGGRSRRPAGAGAGPGAWGGVAGTELPSGTMRWVQGGAPAMGRTPPLTSRR